jgi:ribonuclease BN (tRNA processing enzyme)
MSPDSFTILGSSSGVPQADRGTAAYLLRVNDRLTIIDCGGGATSSFLKRGYDPLDIDSLFISHTHSDHVCELPLLIQMIYLAGRKDPLDIFLPDEFVEIFRRMLPAMYIIPEKLPFEIRIRGYSGGFEYNSEFKLNAIANRHLEKYREHIERHNLPNKMQSHSFRIEVGESLLFYSGDIASFDDIRPHIDGCRYVVTELTHVEQDDFFASASSIDVGQYIITHLAGQQELLDLSERAEKAGLTNLIAAVDGMELSL